MLEFTAQVQVDVAQPGDVGDGVFDLRRQKRTPRPVGEAGGFVERDLGDGLHEIAVRDLIAEAADHRGDLGVEKGRWNKFG